MKELEIEAVKFSPTAKENIVKYDILLPPKIAINESLKHQYYEKLFRGVIND